MKIRLLRALRPGEQAGVVFTPREHAVSRKRRTFRPETRQRAGANNGEDISDDRSGSQLRHVDVRRLPQDCRIGQRKGQNPLANSAANDRDNDKEEGVVRRIPKQRSHNKPAQHGHQCSRHQRNKHAHHALDQQHPVHPQDAADHQAGDDEIEQIRLLHQQMHRIKGLFPECAKIDQHGRHHQTQDRRAADVLQHGDLTPHFGKRKAKGHDDRQSANHIFRQQPCPGGRRHNRGNPDEQYQRNRAHLGRVKPKSKTRGRQRGSRYRIIFHIIT